MRINPLHRREFLAATGTAVGAGLSGFPILLADDASPPREARTTKGMVVSVSAPASDVARQFWRTGATQLTRRWPSASPWR